VGLIPTRYAGTLAEKSHALWLARLTEWIDTSATATRPVGQRMLTTDVDDYALLDVRTIELNVEAPPAGQDGAGAVSDHG
jgi:type VI secretion system protein ImpE